tara:strand:+ start:3297 stop:3575 length:279 start_codon:yes stop_codon:yes gene_type:complete
MTSINRKKTESMSQPMKRIEDLLLNPDHVWGTPEDKGWIKEFRGIIYNTLAEEQDNVQLLVRENSRLRGELLLARGIMVGFTFILIMILVFI